MTVSSGYAPNSSTGNGVTTVFPYNFRILAAADLEVTVGGVVKTLTTDYSVSGVGAAGGGNVTFVVAPANGILVIRRRNMALVRTTDYQDNGDLLADVLNPDQDAAVLMIQQTQEQTDRALKFPLGDAASATLPTAAARAGTLQAYDETGAPVAGPGIASVGTVTANVAAINAVAGSIASVNAVAGDLANINTLAGDLPNVNTVAGAVANVNAVGTAIANVNTVASDVTNIDIVAGNIGSIDGVAVALRTAGAMTNALIGTETSAIAISAEDATAAAMKVVDAANTLNNRTGGVLDAIPGVFGQPKMVTASDGRTMKWSPHNFAIQTTTPGSNVSGSTATTLQTDSDGGTTAAKLTATSAAISGFSQASIIAAGYAGMYFMQEWIVRAGTSTFCYIAFVTGGPTYKHAWFNLTTGTVGTVDAGVTAAISGNRADGTALPSGYFRITAYYNAATAADALCGQCDADASKAVTIGRTFYAEKPFVHLGVLAMDYFANTTAALKVGVPIDYSKGGPRILIEPTVTYQSSFPDDLTNAAWVKTSATAAKTTTGPHGEPCSTLTASGANGTAIQTVASGTTTQNFSAFVRRRTGTGAISITTDNGSTWTDVTSLLNATTYTRVQAAGVANPSIGFKIATSGDAIDVSMALDTNKLFMSSPLPGGSGVRVADSFNVPLSLLTASTAYTVYADYDRLTGSKFPDDANFRIGNVALTQESWLSTVSADGSAAFWVNDGVTSKSYPIWQMVSNDRLEVTAKMEANKHIMSVNGEPQARITTVGLPPMEQVRLGSFGPLFLRKLLIVNRAVDKDDVRTWRYSGVVRNRTLASQVVAYDSDTSFPNTASNREPSLCVLSDDGATADVLVFWMQKHDTGFHVEAPARLMQRKYRFDKAAGTLRPLTVAAVTQQQAGWASGTGHLQSLNAFVVPTGANAGRVVVLFSGLQTPNFTPTQESIYLMHNDADGDPTQWTTPTNIVSAASGTYYTLDPSGSVVILPPSHATAPNRIVTNYYTSTGVKSLYSDDFGATWTSGTLLATARGPNETAMALRPDGSIVAVHRIGVAPLSDRTWSKSTDGGVTFVDQGVLSSFSYAECADGLAQLDPSGAYGAYGKVAISHPADASARKGVQIDIATDSAMTFGSSIIPWNTSRYFGYSSLRSLFGGSHIALAVEGGSVPFNVDNCIFLALIQAR